MGRTEGEQTSSPAHSDQENEDLELLDLFIFDNYLSTHLRDLSLVRGGVGHGVEVQGREIELALVGEIVDTFLDDLHKSLSRVSNWEAKKGGTLVYFDHPTQEYPYLSGAQEKWQVDYDILDSIYRRCLYSYFCFALDGYRSIPPKNEEELADFEKRFQENTEVEFFDGKLNVIFTCSVKPIQVRQETVYQRKWMVKPGLPTRWQEKWDKRFLFFFEGVPEPEKAIVGFSTDVTDPEYVSFPDIGIMTYFDRETGKPKKEFRVREHWSATPISVEREIREFDCRSLTYESPLSGERIEAEEVIIKTRSADKIWRRRRRSGVRRQVVVFEDWVPELEEPREVKRTLEENVYEQVEGEDRVWVEKSRSFFLEPEKTITYMNVGGAMLLIQIKEEPEDPSIPRNLGEARHFLFQ